MKPTCDYLEFKKNMTFISSKVIRAMMKPILLQKLIILIGCVLLITAVYLIYGGVNSKNDYLKKTSHRAGFGSVVDLDTETQKTEKDPLMRKVKRITSSSKFVLATMINDAYLPFTYSWLCNTRDMDVHKLVLVIVTDEDTERKLNKDWPEVTTYRLDGIEAKGDQVYSHAGYVRLMIRRSQVLQRILERDIEIFLFEVDCLWVRNPLLDLRKSPDVDLIVNPISERPGKVAGGFLYMYPTHATKHLWGKLTSMLQSLEEKIKALPAGRPISEGENDQEYLSSLVKTKYGGIEYRRLSLDMYPDGKWYGYDEARRKKTKPYIINNNWVLGNRAKRTRAQKWGHWFLRNDNSCDTEQVTKITQNGP